MAKGILLDTSVVIAHLRGKIDISIQITPSESLFLSVIALGELNKGLLKSKHPQRSQADLATFLHTVTILPVDVSTAWHYAQISCALDANGTPIPENDLWIAAAALECSLSLAARDKHFQQISGLTLL